MATFVETEDCRICIDHAVSLAPRGYGLPPHPVEYKRMEEQWESIKNYAQKADVLIVTHYHYDHHNPGFPELYDGKTVLIKHPVENINYFTRTIYQKPASLIKHPVENINRSQKLRADFFLKQIEGMPEKFEYADGRGFSFGDTDIRFSNAVFHGTGNRLGYVVEVCIRMKEECFVFTSDVEGHNTNEQTDFVVKEKPNIVYLDGPLSYMLGYRYSHESLALAIKNMLRILVETHVEKLVIDHHFLRDLKWKERISPVFETGKKVITAAEFLGIGNELLEARRRELFKEHPVRTTSKMQLEE